MSYYIAKDRFGQLDLCHYGVKGMKWGVVNEDPLALANSRRLGAIQTNPNKRSFGSTSSIGGSKKAAAPVSASGLRTIRGIQDNAANQAAAAGMDDEFAAKLAEAESAYKTALASMQMMARLSLSQGLSPNADPDYISARKAVIKAKYELDKLRLDQQAKAAKEPPPTFAEQKKAADTEAKAERKAAAAEVDDDYASIRRAWINQAFAGKEMPDSMKKLRDSKR